MRNGPVPTQALPSERGAHSLGRSADAFGQRRQRAGRRTIRPSAKSFLWDFQMLMLSFQSRGRNFAEREKDSIEAGRLTLSCSPIGNPTDIIVRCRRTMDGSMELVRIPWRRRRIWPVDGEWKRRRPAPWGPTLEWNTRLSIGTSR